jgi:hypothetical protein
MTAPDKSRRAFVKRGAYVAPAILTLAAAPEFAKAGSIKPPGPPGGGPPGKPPGKPPGPPGRP